MRIVRWSVLAVALLIGAIAFGCGGDDNPANPGPGTADVTITIVANAGASSYSPSPDTVLVGKSVSWHNNGGTTHTATSDDGSAFDTGNIANGGTSTPKTMNTVGSFPYHCEIHNSMTGILVVK